MVDGFQDVVGYADKHSVHNRVAYMLALDRVASSSNCADCTHDATGMSQDPSTSCGGAVRYKRPAPRRC